AVEAVRVRAGVLGQARSASQLEGHVDIEGLTPVELCVEGIGDRICAALGESREGTRRSDHRFWVWACHAGRVGGPCDAGPIGGGASPTACMRLASDTSDPDSVTVRRR